MSDRFFSDAPITSNVVTLEGPEAHHLLHVMRAKVGQRVMLFDGDGTEFGAEVARLGRASADLRIVSRCDIDRELAFPLTVGVALPKGERQKWLVEKLTELGATTLVPLTTERGVAQPTAGALDRLRRSVIEAAKQCGRNRLMQINDSQTWSDWVRAGQMRAWRLIAHPEGKSLAALERGTTGATQIAIGPEGGFSDSEAMSASDAGWQAVSLGPRILRVETAAVALVASIALGSLIPPAVVDRPTRS